MNKTLLSSKNMNWCTPQDFYDELNNEFHFGLDAAATDKTTKCQLYFTPETDGLNSSWKIEKGAVFCNPPYGREIGKWVKKLTKNRKKGRRLCYSSRQGQIRAISTITYTAKRKFALSAVGYASPTKTETRPIPRHSHQC